MFLEFLELVYTAMSNPLSQCANDSLGIALGAAMTASFRAYQDGLADWNPDAGE